MVLNRRSTGEERVASLRELDLIDDKAKRLFDSIRRNGNQGAHPEKSECARSRLPTLAENTLKEYLSLFKWLMCKAFVENFFNYLAMPTILALWSYYRRMRVQRWVRFGNGNSKLHWLLGHEADVYARGIPNASPNDVHYFVHPVEIDYSTSCRYTYGHVSARRRDQNAPA